jgi:ribonucleotide reductase beta subunit family protein with ferritin-like domain
VLLLKTEEKELIDFFREQAKLEDEIVKSVNKALKNLKNPVVVSVLKGMSLDSMKHADLYKAAESIVSVAPAMSEKELNHLNEVVSWHISNEEKVINRLGEFIKKVSDEKVKFLLKSIAADEQRHHELLKTIMETIVRGETITENEWWEIIWKNVPFHGAPGG